MSCSGQLIIRWVYCQMLKGDEAFAKRKQGVQKNELNEQLKDYINQWRDER